MARTARPKPNLGKADSWPHAASTRPEHEAARRLVVNVREAMAGASIRSVAARAGIDHNTLRNVLAGEAWPDLIVIAKLESALDADLWPGRF